MSIQFIVRNINKGWEYRWAGGSEIEVWKENHPLDTFPNMQDMIQLGTWKLSITKEEIALAMMGTPGALGQVLAQMWQRLDDVNF